jgi:hypothetical protein
MYEALLIEDIGPTVRLGLRKDVVTRFWVASQRHNQRRWMEKDSKEAMEVDLQFASTVRSSSDARILGVGRVWTRLGYWFANFYIAESKSAQT